MASYQIARHFKDLRADTGRKKGRPSPFATGFEDDDSEKERQSSGSKIKAAAVRKPAPTNPTSNSNESSPFAAIDAIRDSDDEFLAVTPKRSDRRPSPAPASLAKSRVTDRAGRRGSVDSGSASLRASRTAAAHQAAGPLAFLDDSDDDDEESARPSRADRRPSPAPGLRKPSDSVDSVNRSPGGTPRGTDSLAPKEHSQTRSQPSRHTVASPFAGTKYLEDSDSDEEAVISRQNSTDSTIAPDNTSDDVTPKLEIPRVDKPKQNGSGISWRAFSAGRTEQRNAEVEALQTSLNQRGRKISFCPTVTTDDGNRIPLSPTLERASFVSKGSFKSRGKSPPKRAEDTRPTEDERMDGGVYDPSEYKTNPFTAVATTDALEALPVSQTSVSTAPRHEPADAKAASSPAIARSHDDTFDSIDAKVVTSPETSPEKRSTARAYSLATTTVVEDVRQSLSRRSSARSIGVSIPRSPRLHGEPSRRSSRRTTSGQTSLSPAQAFLTSWSRADQAAEEVVVQPNPDDEGQQIGLHNEYIIGRIVGRGGFGVVKELHSMNEHGSAIIRAVKIVRRTVPNVSELENEKAQQDLEHEVSVWRHLDHQHILRLHAVYETDFATFCVMDLNEGGTLFELLRMARNAAINGSGRKGLAPHLAKSYAHQLASALRYLHEDIRVCHRDVKLENCLIDLTSTDARENGGMLRLCDFGLADFLHGDQSVDEASTHRPSEPPTSDREPLPLQTASSVIGTLEYASPRGLSVHRKLFETAGDVWAYGVVVYALCTGVLPFRHAMPSKTAELILRAEWDDHALRDAAAGGGDVIDLVKGCLDKDIDTRYVVSDILKSPWFADLESDDEGSTRRLWAR